VTGWEKRAWQIYRHHWSLMSGFLSVWLPEDVAGNLSSAIFADLWIAASQCLRTSHGPVGHVYMQALRRARYLAPGYGRQVPHDAMSLMPVGDPTSLNDLCWLYARTAHASGIMTVSWDERLLVSRYLRYLDPVTGRFFGGHPTYLPI